MRIRWRGLELPNQVICDEESSTDRYTKFTIEPFERGFGTTIGNSLRRILLSSLEGAAVTRVRIAGAAHEFTSLPGVLEDLTDIVLNIKGLAIRMETDDPTMITVAKNTEGEVKAGDIQANPNVEIVDAGHYLATLTADVEFSIEMAIEKGRGWRAAEENLVVESDVNFFPIDSSFSPVTRVRYRAEDTRVGQRTNYDRLIMEIWTNGTVKPEDALVEAAKILRKHLNPFVLYDKMGADTVDEPIPEIVGPEPEIDADLQAKLNMSIAEFDLSVRASNCLESARILTVGELARCSESDLLRVRSFGKTSLREVKRKLAELGMSLGMDFGEGGGGNKVTAISTTPAHLTADDLLPAPPPQQPSARDAQQQAGGPAIDSKSFQMGH